MNTDLHQNLENSLARLQYILIARRVLASDEKIRLNWNQFDIMVLIKSSVTITPAAISKALGFSRPNTSKYLKYLEENGLIKTVVAKNDKRSHAVHLTKLSQTILNKIDRGQRDTATRVMKALTDSEVNQFIAITEKVIKTLDSSTLKEI